MTDHTINENETDNIMGKKENENLEDLFAEVEQLIAHMEEDISLDESFVCYEQGMKKLKHCSERISVILLHEEILMCSLFYIRHWYRVRVPKKAL